MTVWPNGSKSRPPIRSPFGWRTHPVTGRRSLHAGTDFVGFREVRAVEAGTVRVVGTPGGWTGGGRQVWIQHDGWFSRSMHLASTSVSNGQWVSEGQVLGIMGMTGTATGVHLHLEVTRGNVHYSNTGQIDPVPFIQARINQPTGGGGAVVPPSKDKDEDDMARNSGVYYDAGPNTITYLIFNTESGWYHEYSNGEGNGPMPSAYNNGLATALYTPSWAKVTASHARVIKQTLDAIK